MLDFNEELAKFQPCADLEEAEENIYGKELEEIKKNKTELYKANQMIKKYNQALNYAKQGNDDLAMLQLKNVVAAIPNFVDAYLLMALLSIKGENYDNARTFLDTILKIDPNNESAVEYGKEFETKVVEEEPQTTEPEKKDKKKKEKKKVVSQPEEPKKKKNPLNISSIQENEAGKSPMFYMVTGMVIGVIVAAVLIYPTVRASFSHKNSTQVEDYKEQILAKDTQLKASEKKVKEAKAAQKKAEELVQNNDTGNVEDAFTYAESREEEAARLQKEQEEQKAQAAGNGQAIVDYACQFIGNPYVWGGTSLTNGADCSGFVQSVFAHFGIALPRTTWDMENAGTAVSYDQAVAGDIILYNGHVGIYMGNGQIVNAINSAKGIGILPATYTNIVTVRRLV